MSFNGVDTPDGKTAGDSVPALADIDVWTAEAASVYRSAALIPFAAIISPVYSTVPVFISVSTAVLFSPSTAAKLAADFPPCAAAGAGVSCVSSSVKRLP